MLAVDEKGDQLKSGCHNAIIEKLTSYDLQNPRQNSIPNIPASSRAFYKSVMDEFGALMYSCPTEGEVV